MHHICGYWNFDMPRTALAQYYGYTERGGRYLNEAERIPVVQSGMRFVQRYHELAKLAIRRRNVMIKAHVHVEVILLVHRVF